MENRIDNKKNIWKQKKAQTLVQNDSSICKYCVRDTQKISNFKMLPNL